MGPVGVFNAVEAVWWMVLSVVVLSVVVLSAGRLRPEPFRGLHQPIAGCLFLFGLTDVAEIRTGAWWTPVWLAILNVLCVAGLAVCAFLWLKRR